MQYSFQSNRGQIPISDSLVKVVSLKIFAAKLVFWSWLLLNASISLGHPGISSIEIEKYIEDRMLFGNPTDLMEHIDSERSESLIRLLENIRGKSLSEAQKKKIFFDINESFAKRAVPPLSALQATEQFDTWKRCLANSYQNGLSAKSAESLRTFVASQTHKLIPRMRRPLSEWLGTILRRIQEYPSARDKIGEDVKKFSENDQLFSLRMRQAEVVTAVFSSDLQVRSLTVATGASLESVFITMLMNAEDIHQIALSQGLNETQWESVLEYAGSDLAKFEQVAYEKCFGDSSLISPAVMNMTKNLSEVLNDVFKRNAELIEGN